jgi:hypothetical protein
MSRFSKLFEVSLLGVIAILALMAMTLMIRLSSLWSQEAAGWAQAIGSVAAILGSFAIARGQALVADKARKLDQLEMDAALAQGCYHLVADTAKCLFNVSEKFKKMDMEGHSKIGVERLEDLQQTYIALCGKALPASVFNMLLDAKKELAYAMTDVRENNETTEPEPEHRKKARARLRRIRELRVGLEAISDNFSASLQIQSTQ